MKYVADNLRRGPKHWRKILLLLLVVGLIAAIGVVIGIRKYYEINLRPPGASQQSLSITIPKGASLRETAQLLKREGIIRSAWSFERYVQNKNAADKIKAGTYELNPTLDVSQVVSIITEGKVATNLITILPGKRLDQIKLSFIRAGFTQAETDAAFQPELYKNHPALVDKPTEASLEGYLYPESFQRTSGTKPSEIVNSSLNEMQSRLTPELRAAIVKQGLTVHSGIILASIVERESGLDADKPIIAQVFLRRLREGRKLESDATASYGAAISGKLDSLTHDQALRFDSAYNTYLNDGLPPGPISNVAKTSLEAVANPSPTDYLYFVADDEGQDKGRSFFSRTLEEHKGLIAEHCKHLCD